MALRPSKAMTMLILYSDAVFQEHLTGAHPENPARLLAIAQELEGSPVAQGSLPGTIVAARAEDLLAVHTEEHLGQVAAASKSGASLDPDTRTSERSGNVAQLAAGVACDAVRRVVQEPGRRALCLIRPPGHHALPDRAMGFCLFNNVAVAARFARRELALNRVLIVDWDVHHGNGTQDVFYRDPAVTFLSIHRFPFYPGTGGDDETGAGDGLGTTFNVPVSFGTMREKYFDRFRRALDLAVARSKPELILISAGFDAHKLDPIGSLGLETEDFGRLTDLVIEAADAECQGRVVSLLEGGYQPQALAESVRVHLERLAGAS